MECVVLFLFLMRVPSMIYFQVAEGRDQIVASLSPSEHVVTHLAFACMSCGSPHVASLRHSRAYTFGRMIWATAGGSAELPVRAERTSS